MHFHYSVEVPQTQARTAVTTTIKLRTQLQRGKSSQNQFVSIEVLREKIARTVRISTHSALLGLVFAPVGYLQMLWFGSATR